MTTPPITCQWFAMCDQPAAAVARGPIGGGLFGWLPICPRCAAKLRLDTEPLELEAQA